MQECWGDIHYCQGFFSSGSKAIDTIYSTDEIRTIKQKNKKKLENKAHIIATNTSKNRFFVFILFLRKQTFKNVLGI